VTTGTLAPRALAEFLLARVPSLTLERPLGDKLAGSSRVASQLAICFWSSSLFEDLSRRLLHSLVAVAHCLASA
jgi:hypothetical protein